MVMLGITFAAAVGSMFGMNLNSRNLYGDFSSEILRFKTQFPFSDIQEQYYAFFIVIALTFLLTVIIIVCLVRWVHSIMTKRRTKNFRVLKDFASFIDALEVVR